MQKIADLVSFKLTEKQKNDDNNPEKINSHQIIFGCTGTIGETYPFEIIKKSIPNLVEKIKYTQNKYVWTKAALGIMTTDTKPKLSMEECQIGNENVKIYGIAKGSGMIHPNMATTLVYVFTDATLSNDILGKLLKKNMYQKQVNGLVEIMIIVNYRGIKIMNFYIKVVEDYQIQIGRY